MLVLKLWVPNPVGNDDGFELLMPTGPLRCLARLRAIFSPSSSRGTMSKHLRLMQACFLMPEEQQHPSRRKP